jgi:hypothetical protein
MLELMLTCEDLNSRFDRKVKADLLRACGASVNETTLGDTTESRCSTTGKPTRSFATERVSLDSV